MSAPDAPGPGPVDPLERLFSQVPRRSAPDVTLQSVLDRVEARRSAAYVGAAVALVAAIVVGALSSGTPPPPVHHDVEVVDIDTDNLWPEAPGEDLGRTAEEMEKP